MNATDLSIYVKGVCPHCTFTAKNFLQSVSSILPSNCTVIGQKKLLVLLFSSFNRVANSEKRKNYKDAATFILVGASHVTVTYHRPMP